MAKRGSAAASRSAGSWRRIRLVSWRASRPSKTGSGGSVPKPTTASAASRVQPPANTASRLKRVCCAGSRRSWLQAIAPRSVCCRSGRSRPPPVRSVRRLSRRARIAFGGRSRTRDAASSMASGRPSRRRQMATTVSAFSSVSSKWLCTARARSTKRRTASEASASSSRSGPASGRELQGWDRELILAGDVERRPAGGENLDIRTVGEEVGDERRRVDDVLEVVEHQEQASRPQIGAQRRLNGARWRTRECRGRRRWWRPPGSRTRPEPGGRTRRHRRTPQPDRRRHAAPGGSCRCHLVR